MNDEIVNNNFFKKVWYSITKFEKYPEMSAEGFGRCLKYLATLTAIFTIFICIGAIFQITATVNDLTNYIEKEIPNFTYSEGKLNVESSEIISIQEDYSPFDIIKIDTNANLTRKDEIMSAIPDDKTAILFFDDAVFVKALVGAEDYAKYTYSNLENKYFDINNFSKANLLNYLKSSNMYKIYGIYLFVLFISMFIVYLFTMILDVLELALLGYIAAILAKIKMRFVAIYNMAGYAITLSVLLNILYIVVNYFTEFNIQYFQVAYIAIAYIYLITVIFIIKDEFIKKQIEVNKIIQEQQKIREELAEKEVKDKAENEDNKKTDKEKNKNKEQGEENDNQEDLGNNVGGSEA